jgi:DNA-binding response OmpR family regulator
MNTILLVDDNERLTAFTARILESRMPGLDVHRACSCAEARESVLEVCPDVIVLDWLLPDGSGMNLLIEIRQSLPWARIIVTSAESSAEFHKKALSCGAFDVVSKPFDMGELASLVRSALENARCRRESPHDAEPAGEGETASQAPRFDRHLLMNRLSGLMAGLRAFGADLKAEAHDPDAVNETVDEYLDRLVNTVREVSDMLASTRDGSEPM